MTSTQLLLIVIVTIPLALVIANRLRVDIAALTIAVALGAAQFFGLSMLGAPNTPDAAARAIAGLSQPVVVTLVSLFIMTRCLDKTGITRWIARQILKVGGQSERRLIALFASATAMLSLFMNNLAAGALLLLVAALMRPAIGAGSGLASSLGFCSFSGGLGIVAGTDGSRLGARASRARYPWQRIGENIGGGQREDDYTTLRHKILSHGLALEPFNWYLDLRRYGTVPHAGFGMGIERVVAWLCGLHHIRETIPFPRMMERLEP